MSRFLFVVVLLVMCGIGLGYYRGWFSLSVDHDKIQEDERKIQERVGTK